MRYLVPLGFLLASTTCVAAADFGGSSYDGSLKDGPVLAQRIWSGIYVGAHAGYGWADWSVDLSHSQGAIHYKDPFDPAVQSLSSSDGWFGGIQVGFNRQHGSIVWGLEADASWSDLKASGQFETPDVPNYGPECPGDTCTRWDIDTRIDVFGTVRGRIGFLATPSLLVYGTGGLAWAKVDMNQVSTDMTSGDTMGRTSGSANHIGWTAGAGGEFMLTNNLAVKAEWLYVDLGEETYGLKGPQGPNNPTPWTETVDTDLSFHTIRLGVNYKFGSGQ